MINKKIVMILVTLTLTLTPILTLNLGLEDEDLGLGPIGVGDDSQIDPLEAFEAYGERLVLAADACFSPTQTAILRGVTLLG
jgi:hypothetical protein